MKEAWKQGVTGKGVVVSILDDGIEKNHPDLEKNYVSLRKKKKTYTYFAQVLNSHFLLKCIVFRILMLAMMWMMVIQTLSLDILSSTITGKSAAGANQSLRINRSVNWFMDDNLITRSSPVCKRLCIGIVYKSPLSFWCQGLKKCFLVLWGVVHQHHRMKMEV